MGTAPINAVVLAQQVHVLPAWVEAAWAEAVAEHALVQALTVQASAQAPAEQMPRNVVQGLPVVLPGYVAPHPRRVVRWDRGTWSQGSPVRPSEQALRAVILPGGEDSDTDFDDYSDDSCDSYDSDWY